MTSENRKKLDNRIRILIENSVQTNHRSFFVIVGEKSKSQIPILYHMLVKSSTGQKPSILWCYKKDLGFSTNQKKRMRLLKKHQSGGKVNEDNPFEMFVASTQITYCYYRDSERILGNTFGMLVLQDFEAITPNLLARTVETVQGGGLVVILMDTVDSLQQLYTLSMDVHDRFRTDAHQDIVPRFNERFLLSLSSCTSCIVIDDMFNVLPISSHAAHIEPLAKPENIDEPTESELQLRAAQDELQDRQPLGALSKLCKTIDQLNALVSFVDALTEKTLKTTVSLTAARGRGKSATLGLAIAAAIGHHYSNIYLTSPSPENLKTLFEFVLKGFVAINLKQHLDYEIIYSTDEGQARIITRINVFREHRQTIQYINPVDVSRNRSVCQAAEIVIIDEAAAIPLPIVKSFFGPYLVFLSSTINGYEGTGRSLSLKLLHQLRQQAAALPSSGSANQSTKFSSSQFSPFGRRLQELTLSESIRYSSGDEVEKWLNHLLCLDASAADSVSTDSLPLPEDCELYYVNRDTLFSYHKVSETFLQRLVALYVSSHYKNSPNDLQMMSDAPSHHLFCLLPPMRPEKLAKRGSIHGRIPEVLCFIQVALEGDISAKAVEHSLARGHRSSGDLIPWSISQQFQETNFASLSSARIIRIATNPNCVGKGYGTRALKLLEEYYRGIHSFDLSEDFNNRSNADDGDANDENDMNDDQRDANDIRKRSKKALPPLLSKLSERKAEKLDYIGTAYGLTYDLLKFWKKNGFTPLYLRQTPNELTGEHSCIMIKLLSHDGQQESRAKNWLVDFYFDFRIRLINLLAYQFSVFPAKLALSLLVNENVSIAHLLRPLTKQELEFQLSLYDLKRLEKYAQNLVDYHLIVDLLPRLANLYFQQKFPNDITLSAVQSSILLSIGLQHKTIEQISAELELDQSQVMGLFIRAIARLTKHMRKIEERSIEETLGLDKQSEVVNMQPLAQRLEDELEEAAQEVSVKDINQSTNGTAVAEFDVGVGVPRAKLDLVDLNQYAIKGTEDEWKNNLKGKSKEFLKVETLKRKSFGGNSKPFKKGGFNSDSKKQGSKSNFNKKFKN